MTFTLAGFDLISEELVAEIPLRRVTVKELREIFRTGPTESFNDDWPADAVIADKLAPFIDEAFDPNAFDWFLCSYSEES